MPEDCANPLLLGWIKEWLDQARERNSKGVTVYKKAYESMKACPLRFDHPKEAQQLHGLGPKLCDRLTDKLKTHCAANGLPMPQLPGRGSKRKSDDEASDSERPAKKARKPKPYVPALRSGAYGLVLALATLDEAASQGLTKAEVIDLAQPYSDSSFTAPSDPTKFYTAWNSMKTLVDKDLVYEQGRPLRKYMLTDEGWEVAKRIRDVGNGSTKELIAQEAPAPASPKSKAKRKGVPRPASAIPQSGTDASNAFVIPDLTPSPERTNRRREVPPAQQSPELVLDTDQVILDKPTALPTFEPIVLPPGSFSVHLVLDTREVRTKSDRDYISSELSKRGVNALTRALPLGDALWIAQVKPSHTHILTTSNIGDSDEGSDEIMLDHIAERKRLDDLIGSIKDGRFHEQKFRLRKSGVQNVIYIIEDFSLSSESSEKYGDAVESAIASTQVVNDYFVKQTAKLDDTIHYLARMTKALQRRYEPHELRLIPTAALDPRTYLPLLERDRQHTPHHITFSAFASLCGKSDAMTLRDVFLKMLMCTRGVTGEKAVEIQKCWPTPCALVEAFEKRAGKRERETLVSERLQGLIPRKKVARALSAKIAEIWG